MPRCAVAGCPAYVNSKKPCKARDGGKLSFFRFPADAVLCHDWIVKCKRGDTFDPNTERICSDHFVDNDFEPSYLSRLSLGFRVRPSLKRDAVPSSHLPSKHSRLVEMEPF